MKPLGPGEREVLDRDPGDETQPIRTWSVWSPLREDEDGIRFDAGVVYAPSASEAKELYIRDACLEQGAIGDSDWCDTPQQEISQIKAELVDHVPPKLGPGVENDPDVLRLAGHRMEDESACESCGLAANGIDKYEVCRSCHCCTECGHDTEDYGDGPCTGGDA